MKTILSSQFMRSPLTTVLINSSLNSYTQEVVDKAKSQGETLPSNMTAYDNLINTLDKAGIMSKLDTMYVLNGDGSTGFKLLNIINPNLYNGTVIGTLTWSNDGVVSDGTTGYIDTTMNPALLGSTAKFKLTDASGGVVLRTSDNTVAPVMSSYNIQIRSDGTHNQVCSMDVASTDMNARASSGLRVNLRSGSTIMLTAKDEYRNPTPTLSTSLQSSKFYLLLENGRSRFSKSQISFAFTGGALTYDETQTIRTAFNAYLVALGMTAYA